jgi:hypothetical protein
MDDFEKGCRRLAVGRVVLTGVDHLTSSSSGRLAELEREIDALQSRYDRHLDRMQRPGRFVGREEGAVNANALQALEAAIGLAQTKRANLHAGLPEDCGIKAPVDLDRVIEHKVASIRAEFQKKHKDFIKLALDALGEVLNSRLDPIEKRLLDAEQAKFCGVFQRQISYLAGNFVTHRGAVWHCNTPCKNVEPGNDPSVWTLAVKSGKDERRTSA